MSQENVKVMRAAIEAFNRRDGEGFDSLLADDAEIVPVRAALEGIVYRVVRMPPRNTARLLRQAGKTSPGTLRRSETVGVGFSSWVTHPGPWKWRGVAIDARGAWLGAVPRRPAYNLPDLPRPTPMPSKPWVSYEGAFVKGQR